MRGCLPLTPEPAPGLDLRKLPFEKPTDSFLRSPSRRFLDHRYASTKIPIKPTSAPKHAPTIISTFGVLGLAPPIVGVSSTAIVDGTAVADVEGVAVAVTVCWVVHVLTWVDIIVVVTVIGAAVLVWASVGVA